MKKFLLLVALIATTTMGAFAQSDKGEKSVVIHGGVKSNPGRFMLGAEGRYNIIDNLRLAPDVYFVFPKDKVTGLDVDVNLQYVINLNSVTPDLAVYPLMGLSMQNNRFSGRTIAGDVKVPSSSYTDWGFNLGGGIEYGITGNSFLNLEMKYTFSDADCFTVFFGYGFKF